MIVVSAAVTAAPKISVTVWLTMDAVESVVVGSLAIFFSVSWSRDVKSQKGRKDEFHPFAALLEQIQDELLSRH